MRAARAASMSAIMASAASRRERARPASGDSFDARRGGQNDSAVTQLLKQGENDRGAVVRRHRFVGRAVEQVTAISARAWPQSEMFRRLREMLAASCVAAGVVPENRPWRADLLGEELDQGGGRLVFEAQSKTRISEQADLHGHAELIAGAALRQDEVAVGVAERIEPDQGGVVAGRLEKPLCAPPRSAGLVAPLRPPIAVRQSILSRSIADLSGNHA